MSLLLVCAEANAQIGTGHVLRSLALGQAWKKQGGEFAILSSELPAGIQSRYQAEHAQIFLEGTQPESIRRVAERERASWVLIDGYTFGIEHQRAAQSTGARVMVTDDDGVTGEYVSEFVLDANVFASDTRYQKKAPTTQLLLGPSYALLRSEFLETDERVELPSQLKRLLLSFGGADATGASRAALQALEDAPYEVTLLVGSANPRRLELEERVQRRPDWRVLYDIKNVPECMAASDVAIVAAGSICLELAFMGLPSLTVVTAENQKRVAGHFDELGIMKMLGSDSRWVDRLVPELANMQSLETRKTMSDRGRELVDGRGAERVVKSLLERI